MQPYYPADNLGLLCTSRQIHEEASAILFENIHVGSDAARAWRFLSSLGPDRIFKIRTVTIYYHCLEWCKPTAIHGDEELDWMPVLELLRSSAVRMDGVEVSFAPCVVECRENNHYLQTRCRLWWDENSDRFWQGLETLNTVKQIRFLDPVPEYFVRRTTKRLGWGIHGELDGGYADPFQPLSRFKGLILNTTSANDSPASQQTGTHQSTGFLDLPLEIRHRIYNCACEWTYKPSGLTARRGGTQASACCWFRNRSQQRLCHRYTAHSESTGVAHSMTSTNWVPSSLTSAGSKYISRASAPLGAALCDTITTPSLPRGLRMPRKFPGRRPASVTLPPAAKISKTPGAPGPPPSVVSNPSEACPSWR
jgi:hypothetical protein